MNIKKDAPGLAEIIIRANICVMVLVGFVWVTLAIIGAVFSSPSSFETCTQDVFFEEIKTAKRPARDVWESAWYFCQQLESGTPMGAEKETTE